MAYKTYACASERSCGACQLLAVPYPIQLRRKQREVAALFEPYIASGCETGDAAVAGRAAHAVDAAALDPIIGMDDPRAFRNKVIAPFAPGAAHCGRGSSRTRGPSRKATPRRRPATSVSFGMYAQGTHRIVPVESCLVEHPAARPIIASVARLAESFGIEAYDEDTGRGLLRHVVVRISRATGEAMVTLVLTSRDIPNRREFTRRIVAQCPQVSTIVINVNPKITNAVLGDSQVVAYGKGHITEELCGCKFRLSSQSFFQTNPSQTERLYARAIELAGLTGEQRVLDAYCGIGTIAIVAAKAARSVVGVERNAGAVRDARANARLNDARNVEFVAADSAQWAFDAAASGESFDVAFMDPPRSGSSEGFLCALAELGPMRVVYISCDPATQRRDVDVLARLGYELRRISPVDMFAHTMHIENICLLERGSK